ncbi:hypothetical protein [Shewanella halifaxensis]|uniref:hypothetical protein n=1 Tax=Shewanella halifaxensis TaxID=271098 RepID=UPI0013A642C4|nr:hypothetical protein [Shewanella halifaxensis]
MRINNFVGAARVMQEGEAVVPLLPECELEAHDPSQAQPDALKGQTKFDCLKHSLLDEV